MVLVGTLDPFTADGAEGSHHGATDVIPLEVLQSNISYFRVFLISMSNMMYL